MEKDLSRYRWHKNGITLRHDETRRVYHLVRVKQAEVSPTAQEEEAMETITDENV